jgi:hypothetical protein
MEGWEEPALFWAELQTILLVSIQIHHSDTRRPRSNVLPSEEDLIINTKRKHPQDT